MALRRAAGLVLEIRDGQVLDVAALLGGTLVVEPASKLVATTPLGAEHELSPDDVRALLDPGDDEATARLASAGILVDDEPEAGGWHPDAARFHFATRWRDVAPAASFEPQPRERESATPGLEALRAALGPPPPHFHRAGDGDEAVPLPSGRRDGGLYRLLAARETRRSFDAARPTTRDELATVLRYTVGCHGTARLLDDLVVLKKTVPSSGGLHAIEAYPLVASVDGVAPGLYHYEVERHELAPIELLDPSEAERLVVEATGQAYLRSAHVLLILTARFERSFWRYRRHPKAYAALLMDAAHVSQTLYLVCTDLGLGAFVSAAVNNASLDDRLGLDPLREGVVLACGFGRPAADELRQAFDPFEPS
jgi:putative peptide maturation dehydrogenase